MGTSHASLAEATNCPANRLIFDQFRVRHGTCYPQRREKRMSVDANQNVTVDSAPLSQAAESVLPVRPPTAPVFGLLNAACSSEVAKATLENTFSQLSPLQKLLLSRRLGYDSFNNMLAASTVATLSDGSSWWLTADRDGAWTAWNLCQLELAHSGQTDDHATNPQKPR